MWPLIMAGASLAAQLGTDIWNLISQQDAQKAQWAREDSAVQRRMADLKAAGINPVLAAGQAATSQQAVTPQFEGGRSIANAIDTAAKVTQMQQMHAGIAQTKAQEELIRAQAEKTKVESDFMRSSNPIKLAQWELGYKFDQETYANRVQVENGKLSTQQKEQKLLDLQATLKTIEVPQKVEELANSILRNFEEHQLRGKQMDKLDKELFLMQARIDLMKAQTNRLNRQPDILFNAKGKETPKLFEDPFGYGMDLIDRVFGR